MLTNPVQKGLNKGLLEIGTPENSILRPHLNALEPILTLINMNKQSMGAKQLIKETDRLAIKTGKCPLSGL